GLVLAAMLALAVPIAGQRTALWLASGLGLFAVGWVIQFVGHFYEGRKPAFMDDIMGLIIGPLFVAAELGFAMGLRKEVRAAVEQRSGPVRRRSLAGA
ncbi:MAG: Mpo1-like protein, partial [Comamonas sp.]